MQNIDFKQKLSVLLSEKTNIYPINTHKIVYTNGTGLMLYKNPRWFSDIYYYCSKILYENPNRDLEVIFFAGGNGMRIRQKFYVKDLTNLLDQLRKRFIDRPSEYEFLESCINKIEEFSLNFIFS